MRVLSLGAGVQSTTLALLADVGVIQRPDVAIFADTQWEPKHVYAHLNWLTNKLSYPVCVVSAGDIRADLLDTSKRFASIPFFTASGGMGRRQCTNEYKIQPIKRKVRALLGKSRYDKIPKGHVKMLIGISTDEASRMKPSRVQYIKNTWPLIDLNMSRQDCFNWIKEHGYPTPPKSSCIGCPFHSDDYWIYLRDNHSDDFEDAVRVDNLLRESKRDKLKEQQYMHRLRQPLSSVEFKPKSNREMFNGECEGICGN